MISAESTVRHEKLEHMTIMTWVFLMGVIQYPKTWQKTGKKLRVCQAVTRLTKSHAMAGPEWAQLVG